MFERNPLHLHWLEFGDIDNGLNDGRREIKQALLQTSLGAAAQRPDTAHWYAF
jgi:hypothetical protein